MYRCSGVVFGYVLIMVALVDFGAHFTPSWVLGDVTLVAALVYCLTVAWWVAL